jgi:hypothetical protein
LPVRACGTVHQRLTKLRVAACDFQAIGIAASERPQIVLAQVRQDRELPPSIHVDLHTLTVADDPAEPGAQLQVLRASPIHARASTGSPSAFARNIPSRLSSSKPSA